MRTPLLPQMSSRPLALSSASSALLLGLLSLTACDPPPTDSRSAHKAGAEGGAEAGVEAGAPSGGGESCIPDCEGRSCGVEPRCGQSCGECATSEVCEAGLCVAEPTLAGQEGGSSSPVAGIEPVGGVSAGSATQGGEPACTPSCAGLTCGAPDSCGGTCSPCPSAISCEGCALRLRLLELGEVAGRVSSARLALELALPEGAPHPEMADIHISLQGPALIGRVGLGEATLNAQKQLVPDPATGLPYRASGERYSFMLLSTQNTNTIPSGELLVLELQLGDTQSEPVVLNVIHREQTFAPPSADLQLWGAPESDGLVIWPALSQGE